MLLCVLFLMRKMVKKTNILTENKGHKKPNWTGRNDLSVESRLLTEITKRIPGNQSKLIQCLEGRTRNPSTFRTMTKVIRRVVTKTPRTKSLTQRKSAKKTTSQKKNMCLAGKGRLVKEEAEAEEVEVVGVKLLITTSQTTTRDRD